MSKLVEQFLAKRLKEDYDDEDDWEDEDEDDESRDPYDDDFDEDYIDPEYPEDDDYVISDDRQGLRVSVVNGDSEVFSGEDPYEEAYSYIKDRMKREGYYPNVWSESDHGNFEIINIWEEENSNKESLLSPILDDDDL